MDQELNESKPNELEQVKTAETVRAEAESIASKFVHQVKQNFDESLNKMNPDKISDSIETLMKRFGVEFAESASKQVKVHAKKNCKHCYGKGIQSIVATPNELPYPLVCRCVRQKTGLDNITTLLQVLENTPTVAKKPSVEATPADTPSVQPNLL